MNWTWKRYLKQTAIVAAVVALCFTPIHYMINDPKSWWPVYYEIPYEFLCFVTAIVVVDMMKGQKVFAR